MPSSLLSPKPFLIILTLWVSTALAQNYAVHDAGNFELLITDRGSFGIAQNSMGLIFQGSELLWEGCPMVAYDSNTVAVNTHGQHNYVATPWGGVWIAEPGLVADEEGFAEYEDVALNHPQSARITQRTFVWSGEDYFFVQYTVQNADTGTLRDVYIGQFWDWDIDINQCDLNQGAFDSARGLAYQFNSAGGCPLYGGVKMLSPEPTSLHFVSNHEIIYDWLVEEDEPIFSGWMRSGIFDTTTSSTWDWSTLLSTGPFTLGPGTEEEIWFAVVMGENLTQLQANTDDATNRYLQMLGFPEHKSPALPEGYLLLQNFPNPFNSVTHIPFRLPERTYISLRVYNMLGQEVAILWDGFQGAGNHRVFWDAKGNPSGIYWYCLRVGNFESSKRCILIK